MPFTLPYPIPLFRVAPEYITSVVAHFNRQYEVSISGIAATVELNPSLCPLAPCPLKIEAQES